ncbi:GMC family oxidoreductase N-terminal domain-containing protein [Octadecabacter sp. CECT 8868]|uniref:GMC family oxidoreductase n=1 Tax=Octadecabacter algicola TaxID=2909342 RepID=UPI001F3A015C|nr:GMC family oxidoreductase N-terminal domain-containing protein [Octadecabacter algicola]MCF2906490.1 GMC family oxidoreductase N-terminal domain-containing protein [Octadecabacter algicola]
MYTCDFDYIIVGAGSAGCVLANRLSEGGRFTVALLESGGSDARFWVKVPLGYAVNVANPKVNWGFRTEADEGLNSRSISWPRGRLIGGSSSINAMTYIRGLAQDFDDWAQAGASGWHWDNVRSVFERLETHSELTPDGRHTRGDGPVWVSDLSDRMMPFSDTFLDASRDVGHSVIPDLNADGADGIGYYRSTVRGGLRWSSADAFLRSAKRRANLRIIRNADVARLTIERGRATGVSFVRGGETSQITARKEVIVCAGAINSAKLLHLSGIGPAALLKSHGISVVRDLQQVGQGLQDHLAISYQFGATEPTLNTQLGGILGKLLMGAKYLLTRSGPLSVPVNQVGGFVRSDPRKRMPDMQVYFNPASYAMTPSGKAILDRTPGFQISAQPCRPTSRGRVEIVSSDPLVAPSIQPNSLATDEDKGAAVQAGKVLQKFAAAESLMAVTTQAKTPDLMALDDDGLLSDFKQRASTVYHPTCTCRMGRDEKTSVLDARLRVHGVGGVRVVDASAFPNITSGNTNAPTMMLAMRAADLILEDAL